MEFFASLDSRGPISYLGERAKQRTSTPEEEKVAHGGFVRHIDPKSWMCHRLAHTGNYRPEKPNPSVHL
jgi:hypothetical protein